MSHVTPELEETDPLPVLSPDEEGAKKKKGKKIVSILADVVRRFSFRKVERAIALTSSLVIRTAIVLLAIFVSLFIYREFRDTSYRIRAFRVPESFARDGYDGISVAHQLQDDILQIIKRAKGSGEFGQIDEYKISDEQSNFQVEVAGVGLSPQVMLTNLKEFLGLSTNSISGEIIKHGNTLRLSLRMSGHDAILLIQPLDTADENQSLVMLIESGAVAIRRDKNPFMLGKYFENSDRPEQATSMYRYAIHHQSESAADAYAWWGLSFADSVDAFSRFNKALALDPDNANAHHAIGHWYEKHAHVKRAVDAYKRSLQYDPSVSNIWYHLANINLQDGTGKEDVEAEINCKKCISIDPANVICFILLSRAFYLQNKFSEADDAIEQALYLAPQNVAALGLSIAISQATGGRNSSVHSIDRLENSAMKQLAGLGLNNLAVTLYDQRKEYDKALTILKVALYADSTSREARFTYATTAEVYGLTGNKEGFYSNLEKALQLEFSPTPYEELEPYRSLKKEKRYQDLLSKYKKNSQH